MPKITFYTANGSPTPEIAMQETKLALLGMFGGATITQAEGIWRECSTCPIEAEHSLVIVVLAECSEYDAEWQAPHVAERLREIFQQKEVLYSIEGASFVRVPTPAGPSRNRWLMVP